MIIEPWFPADSSCVGRASKMNWLIASKRNPNKARQAGTKFTINKRLKPATKRMTTNTCLTFLLISAAVVIARPAYSERPDVETHNFVFFARDRELLSKHPFLKIKRLEGAQITYAWKQLERGEDGYDFEDIDADLKILHGHGKKLWIQLQDTTFVPNNQAVPLYIIKREQYNGGANPQYGGGGKVEGWVARRWDPAVQARFQKLFVKLAERYDGVITGINLQETAIGITEDGIAKAPGFTYLGYRDAIKKNMLALKEAFKSSMVMQYVNFMPGESLPTIDKGLVKSLFDYGEEMGVAIGAPDLMPRKPFQQAHTYRFMQEKKKAGKLIIGIAVQDGNYSGETGDAPRPKPGETWPDIVPELARYARETLGASYIFWCIQEPYFTKNVIPFFSKEP